MHHSASPSANPPRAVASAAATSQDGSERVASRFRGEATNNNSDRVASYALHRPVLPISAVLEPIRKASSSVRVDPSERKKAALSAAYYTECSVRGIDPLEADKAVTKVKNQYGKWWPSTNSPSQGSGIHNHKLEDKVQSLPKRPPFKRQKRSVSNASDQAEAGDSISMMNNISVESAYTESASKRRREETSVTSLSSSINLSSAQSLRMVKASLIQDLRDSGGDTLSPKFTSLLGVLHSWYIAQGFDARWSYEDPSCFMDGSWLTLSRPTYEDCLGQNPNGDLLYTLGRLAFDMFRPTGYRCSLQAIFQEIGLDLAEPFCDRPRSFPRRLLQERQARKHKPAMRTNE